MKVSHKWLCEFVDLPADRWTPERVSRVLTDLGLEVEDVVDTSSALKNFVVGKVVSKEAHPKADKLSVCTLDVGAGTRTIVCGAANVAAGQTVPVALIGAVVPSAGFAIEERPLRGITSQGMICSQAELNLGEDASGIWVLRDDLTIGQPLAEALGIDDVIYDIAITPNRADCLSHVGIARELAAYAAVYDGANVHVPMPREAATQSSSGEHAVAVRVEAQDLCPHYIAHVVTGVKAVESPQWLKDRLVALGLRPRNVIVDITNYINMEMGQPLHAFDAGKIQGGTIVVRKPHAAETSTTLLDGKEHTLDADMLLICDAERPVAVAGVMGGQNSEIDEATTSVVVESAYFNPTSIRRTAKKLGLSTDASYRFERGVDPSGVRAAADLAVAMLCELAGGTAEARTEIGGQGQQPEPIHVSYARVRSLLGIEIDDARIDLMLTSLGFAVQHAQGSDGLRSVEPPSWRADVRIEADIAEEVMRMYGIDNIPSSARAMMSIGGTQLPDHLRAGGRHGHAQRERIRTGLVARGYVDCVTNVLGSPDDAIDASAAVRLKNALGQEFSMMRSSLVPSLLKVASHNLRHGASAIKLMEFGSTFERNSKNEFGVQQREVFGMLVCGSTNQEWYQKSRMLDLYDLLGDLKVISGAIVTVPCKAPLAPFSENCVDIMINGVHIGVAGELLPQFSSSHGVETSVMAAIIDVRAIPQQRSQYKAFATFPAVERDLALVVPDAVSAKQILDLVRECGTAIIEDARVFDVFSGGSLEKGHKSVGVRMTFRSHERTLQDADVESVISSVLAIAVNRLHAQVRGITMQTTTEGESK
jgi:phenylalanyl-tRNA synthetase beta chain